MRPSGAGLSGFRSVVAWLPGRGRSRLAIGPRGSDWSTVDGQAWTPAGGDGYDAFSVSPHGMWGGPPARVDGLCA
jgi:hypothetical protein